MIAVVCTPELADDRACPTVAHLKLFLTLLGSTAEGEQSKPVPENAVYLERPPGLIILWDLAQLFMEEAELDENRPSGQTEREEPGAWSWKRR